MTSLYETNILNQPSERKRLLTSPIPIELKNIQANKIIFIGIGSSYWVSRIAEFLWREQNTAASITPYSIQSFDFVRSKHIVSKNDIAVVAKFEIDYTLLNADMSYTNTKEAKKVEKCTSILVQKLTQLGLLYLWDVRLFGSQVL
jgi:hypothetical protein